MSEFTNGQSWTVETDILISPNSTHATYAYRVKDSQGNIVEQGSTVNPIVNNGISGMVYVNVNRKPVMRLKWKQIVFIALPWIIGIVFWLLNRG